MNGQEFTEKKEFPKYFVAPLGIFAQHTCTSMYSRCTIVCWVNSQLWMVWAKAEGREKKETSW